MSFKTSEFPRFSLMRRSYFHNGNDKQETKHLGRLKVSTERLGPWASCPPSQANPARPSPYLHACIGLPLWLTHSSFTHIPEQPSTSVFSLLALAPTVPSTRNLLPHLVNCLSQKFHLAARPGSQEQHDTSIHSCDEVRFTSP